MLTEGSTVFVGDDRIEGAWEQIIILFIYIIMINDHWPLILVTRIMILRNFVMVDGDSNEWLDTG